MVRVGALGLCGQAGSGARPWGVGPRTARVCGRNGWSWGAGEGYGKAVRELRWGEAKPCRGARPT